MSKSDFIESLKANKNALQNMKHMKAATNPSAQPDIADGDYVVKVQNCTLSAREFKVGGGKNKVPCVRFQVVVDRGAYEGTVLTKDYILGRMNDSTTVDEQKIWDRFGSDMVNMGASEGDLRDPYKLSEQVETIAANKPTLRIRCKKNPKGYINLYIQGIVEDEPSPDTEDDAADADAEEGDASEEGEGEVQVQTGDRVRYQPKGGRKSTWTVHSTDDDDRTCTLRDVSGKTVKGVSWDELEFTAQ